MLSDVDRGLTCSFVCLSPSPRRGNMVSLGERGGTLNLQSFCSSTFCQVYSTNHGNYILVNILGMMQSLYFLAESTFPCVCLKTMAASLISDESLRISGARVTHSSSPQWTRNHDPENAINKVWGVSDKSVAAVLMNFRNISPGL